MNLMLKAIAVLTVLAVSAFAHEYPLQFTPAAGGPRSGRRGLSDHGGPLSRVPARTIPLRAVQAKVAATTRPRRITTRRVRGDLTGNLLSITPGAPVTPPILYIEGTRTIYALNGSSTAGSDSALLPNHGYVDAPSPHYTWGPFTPPTGPAAQTVTLTLASDGDLPLDITAASETTALARSHMVATNCVGVLAPGSSCSIAIYYDPTRLAYPTGLMYETLTVTVQSNARRQRYSARASRFTCG